MPGSNDLTITRNLFDNIPHNALVVYDNFDGELDITQNIFNDIGTNRADTSVGIAAIRFRGSGSSYGDLSDVFVTENAFLNNVKTIDNTSGQILDAPCNYWGTTDFASIPAGFIGGDVDFLPFLTDGTDDDGSTPGFQPAPGSCGGLGPVVVYDGDPATTGSVVSSYTNLQDAITDASTLSGYFIEVAAGTYPEVGQIVIDKNLTIHGAGCGNTVFTPTANTGSSGDSRGWWLVNPGIEFHLSNVTLDGSGYLVWQGIRQRGFGYDRRCLFYRNQI
ncbi:MAG: hypothetical protein R3B47_12995 [Bacteroidia bacterium]